MINPNHSTFAFPNGRRLTSESWESYTHLYARDGATAEIRSLRERAEDAIEQLMALLDALDGDCDLEDDTEDEAVDDEGCDPDTDREEDLGWTVDGCVCSAGVGLGAEIDCQPVERLPVTRRIRRAS